MGWRRNIEKKTNRTNLAELEERRFQRRPFYVERREAVDATQRRTQRADGQRRRRAELIEWQWTALASGSETLPPSDEPTETE